MSNPGPRYPYSNGDYRPGIFSTWLEFGRVLALALAVVVPWTVGAVELVRWALL